MLISTDISMRGVGSFCPPLIPNDSFVEIFGKKASAIDKRLAHKTRYMAFDFAKNEALFRNSEMGVLAAKSALQNANLSPHDIDMIVYSTGTPDFPLPPCWVLVQEALGIKDCIGIDIRSGCSGFITGVITAIQFIQSGMINRALIIGSELASSRGQIYTGKNAGRTSLKTVLNFMLFGDAAGALIIERAVSGKTPNIFACSCGSKYADRPDGSTMMVGGSLHPYPSEDISFDDTGFTQNLDLTQELLPEAVCTAIEGFLDEHSITLDIFDHFIFPVDSPVIAKKVLERLHIDREKVISIGSHGGSLANAAVPLSIEMAIRDNLIEHGRKVLVFSAENTRWQHAIIGMHWPFYKKNSSL